MDAVEVISKITWRDRSTWPGGLVRMLVLDYDDEHEEKQEQTELAWPK